MNIIDTATETPIQENNDARIRSRRNFQKVSGVSAVRAVFKKRPNDIIRILLMEDRIDDVRDILSYCAKNKKSYNVTDRESLDKFSDSDHHEGICAECTPRPASTLDDFLFGLKKRKGNRAEVYLGLIGVENPHNIGAIARSAAHFGVQGILLTVAAKNRTLPSAVLRVAEGGAEAIDFIHVDDEHWDYALKEIRKTGVRVFSTAASGKTSLSRFHFPSRSLILLGSEAHGIPKHLLSSSEAILNIQGSTEVESLNVASATSILLYAFHATTEIVKNAENSVPPLRRANKRIENLASPKKEGRRETNFSNHRTKKSSANNTRREQPARKRIRD